MILNCRYHVYRIIVSVNSRSNFFTERIVNLWNTLPPGIVNFNSLSSFKRSIKLVNFPGFS